MRDNDFNNRIRFSGEPERRRDNNSEYQRKGNIIYLAPKGTAQAARRTKQNKKRPLNARVAAIALAAVIGIGGVTSLAKNGNTQEVPSITEMQELGISPQGLSQETIEQFEKYDKYFENFDPKGNYQLTDDSVIAMIDDIEQLHFSVVKEKIANLRGVTVDDVEMHYKFQDGNIVSSVTINSKSETHSNAPGLPFGIGRKNYLSDEIADVIPQVGDLDDLKSELKSDKISKINAIKELQKLYETIESLATSDLVMDKNGNISTIGFKQIDENERVQEERDEER